VNAYSPIMKKWLLKIILRGPITMIKINEEPVTFDHYNDGSCRAKLSLPSYGCGEVEITWLYENDCGKDIGDSINDGRN
jgi:hypothetical protein